MSRLSFSSWCAWRVSEIRRRLAAREERFQRRRIAAEHLDRRTRTSREAWAAASAEMRAPAEIGAVA